SLRQVLRLLTMTVSTSYLSTYVASHVSVGTPLDVESTSGASISPHREDLSQAAVYLRSALLELALRAQEASSKKAIGDAIKDERSFEDVENVHASPVSRRFNVFCLVSYAGDRCRDSDRELCPGVACKDGIDFTLGDRIRSLPLQKVDDERDVTLCDFIVTCAATVAVRRDDGGG